jgi:hypothetical protein
LGADIRKIRISALDIRPDIKNDILEISIMGDIRVNIQDVGYHPS